MTRIHLRPGEYLPGPRRMVKMAIRTTNTLRRRPRDHLVVPAGIHGNMMGKSENPWRKTMRKLEVWGKSHGENQLILELLFSRKSSTRGIYREYMCFFGLFLKQGQVCNM